MAGAALPVSIQPRWKDAVDITIGEVLYLVLVVAVAWWAYSTLREFL